MVIPRILLVASLATIAACSGDDAVTDPPASARTLSISPVYKSVESGASLALYATVTGSASRDVVWSIASPAAGGGSISQSGMYTSPAEISGDSLAVIVRAVLVGDTVSATARISVRPGPLAVLRRFGVGSVYSYAFFALDTNNQKEPGSDKIVGDTLVSVLQTIGGRDSVFEMKDARTFTRKFRHETNGDISSYSEVWAPDVWIRLPFGGGAGQRIVQLDTVRADGTRMEVSVESTYLGRETYLFEGKRYTVQKVRLRSIEKKTGGEFYSIQWDDVLTFAPALGWFVKVDWDSKFDDAVDHWLYGSRSTISAVDLK